MRRIETALVHVLLMLATAAALYPILWVVALALGDSAPTEARIWPWPEVASARNLTEVVTSRSTSGRWLFGTQLLNSVVVSAATALVGLVIAVPAAYALARFRFVGKSVGLRALLATQMFPTVASAIPLYLLLSRLGLLDTRSGLVLCYASTAIPFSIFQMRGAFEAIPVDLEEAAMVDGATRFQAFITVVLPAARPAMAVTALFAFMSAYNEYVLAATLLSSESSFTLPVVLQRYVGEYEADWGRFAAGALLVSAPVMVIFYYLQRHIVSGLTAGSVKG